MKRTRSQENIMSTDIIKINQIIQIISRCNYLFKNRLSGTKIGKLDDNEEKIFSTTGDFFTLNEFTLLVLKNYYLDGTICWQNKIVNGENTYIEIEGENKLIKFCFKEGFTDFDMSFKYVCVYINELYNCKEKIVIDLFFSMIEEIHLYVDLLYVIDNSYNYDGWKSDDGDIFYYSTKEITDMLYQELLKNRFI